jgi:hypothetical protein
MSKKKRDPGGADGRKAETQLDHPDLDISKHPELKEAARALKAARTDRIAAQGIEKEKSDQIIPIMDELGVKTFTNEGLAVWITVDKRTVHVRETTDEQ